eukprot:TRINITY_DN10580_c0_g1_i1.p1 TRINITY_DN10580_c0_g1~~TRINITY_DN10580_c0_g1_i1.p1  ORF type:complete len:267 (-),score=42.13 TRINITY_DN10580_c0_g1_i1:17-817(-)
MRNVCLNKLFAPQVKRSNGLPTSPFKYPQRACYRDEPEEGPERRGFRGTWTAALVVSVLAGAFYVYAKRIQKTRVQSYAVRSVGTATLGGPWLLVDELGRAVRSDVFKGSYPIVYFGFTYCPDICPAELKKMAQVVTKLEKETDLIQPIFISVDPQRDTVEQIRAYTKEFHPRLIGFTGTPEMLLDVCKRYRVYSSAGPSDPSDADDYVVDHTIFNYFLDKNGDFIKFFGVDATVDEMVKEIRLQLEERGDLRKPLIRRFKDFLGI